MKNKDLKKGKESAIGKIIYGFLLFMPLIAIGVTCLYAIFNKNAYKSYSGLKEENATYENVNLDNLVVGETYLLQSTTPNQAYTGTGNTSRIYFNVESVNNYSGNYNLLSAKSCGFYSGNSTTMYYYFYDENNNLIGNNPLTNLQNFSLTIEYLSNNISGSYKEMFNTFNTLYSVTYNDNSYIDSVFYYAVDKVEESNLFNWAENSLIYTGIHNTCTQLSITTTFIPLLLAYWLIISVIYILYDIILMVLIILHNKIHQLQDSLS